MKFIENNSVKALELVEHLSQYLKDTLHYKIDGSSNIIIDGMCVTEDSVIAINTYIDALSRTDIPRFQRLSIQQTTKLVTEEIKTGPSEVIKHKSMRVIFMNCEFDSIEDENMPWLGSDDEDICFSEVMFINCVIKKLTIGYDKGYISREMLDLSFYNTVGTLHIKNILSMTPSNAENYLTMYKSNVSLIADNSNLFISHLKYAISQLEKQPVTLGEISMFIHSRGVKQQVRNIKKMKSKINSIRNMSYEMRRAVTTNNYFSQNTSISTAEYYETDKLVKQLNNMSLPENARPSFCSIIIDPEIKLSESTKMNTVNTLHEGILISNIYECHNLKRANENLISALIEAQTTIHMVKSTVEILTAVEYMKLTRDGTKKEMMKFERDMELSSENHILLEPKCNRYYQRYDNIKPIVNVGNNFISSAISGIDSIRNSKTVTVGVGIKHEKNKEMDYIDKMSKVSDLVTYFDTIQYCSDRFKRDTFKLLTSKEG